MSNGRCNPTNEEPECAEESTDPCGEPTTTRKTYCDGDTTNNVWVERGEWSPEAVGICLLDTMSECQIINVVSRNPRARADLLRVTTDPYLLNLAQTTPSLSSEEPADKLQSDVNNNAGSIPFFTIFKGQPPFAQ